MTLCLCTYFIYCLNISNILQLLLFVVLAIVATSFVIPSKEKLYETLQEEKARLDDYLKYQREHVWPYQSLQNQVSSNALSKYQHHNSDNTFFDNDDDDMYTNPIYSYLPYNIWYSSHENDFNRYDDDDNRTIGGCNSREDDDNSIIGFSCNNSWHDHCANNSLFDDDTFFKHSSDDD